MVVANIGRRSLSLSGVVLLVASTTVTILTVAGAPRANAAAGTPGVPQPGTVLYDEDFENGVATTPVPLTSYVGHSGDTFTAQGLYTDVADCNGVVLTPTSPFPAGYCDNGTITAQVQASEQALVAALGSLNGLGTANHAIADMTYTDAVPPNEVELQSVVPITFPAATNRFLATSINEAGICTDQDPATYEQPVLDFSATFAGGASTSTGDVNPCTAPGGAIGPIIAGYPNLISNNQVSVELLNVDGGGPRGNDQAFDDIEVLDVTPQLDKVFSPSTIGVDGSSTMTFTITNTSELGAKDGWSFAEALPTGLTISSPDEATTNCPGGNINTHTGGTAVVVTGNLDAGDKACTASVSVRATVAGTYTNNTNNVGVIGLDPPGPATLHVVTRPTLACGSGGWEFAPDSAGDMFDRITLATGATSQLGTSPDPINAIGYNAVDGYIYGWDTVTNELIRANGDGTIDQLGAWPPGSQPSAGYDIGDFDASGHLWLSIAGSGSQPWAEVDLSSPSSPTFLAVIHSGTTQAPAGLSGGGDWTWINGSFYRVMQDSGGVAALVKVNPTTMVQTDTGALPISVTNIVATYTDASKHLYAEDADGDIFDIETATREAYQISTGPSSVHDGAQCPSSSAPAKSFTVTKTATSTADPVQSGDVVTYTLVVQNTGSVPYFSTGKASLTDNLAATLDDATYNGDATSGATVSGTTLSWSGVLAPAGQAGATVTITYSVTVNTPDQGDHKLVNVVTTPPGSGGNCTSGSTRSQCTTSTPVRGFDVVKTASAAFVVPGDVLTYTLAITDDSTVAYPASDPAVLEDDLNGVLDDATYDNDASGGAQYLSPDLFWNGPLAAGETVEITYSVTVERPDRGDDYLVNAILTNPDGNCPIANPQPACVLVVPSGQPLATTGANLEQDMFGGLWLTLGGIALMIFAVVRRRALLA
jgi:uncharacterized repeat protein (TIGR01451 family)